MKFDNMYFDELKVLCKSTPIFEPSVCLLEVDRAVFGGRLWLENLRLHAAIEVQGINGLEDLI